MQDMDSVCENIQNFRRLGRYVDGHNYIISLPPELLQQKKIAIEISQLYLVQGHYIRAWNACNAPDFSIFQNGEPSASFTLEICDPDSVALALLAAYIGISRHGRLKIAIRIADRVHDAWLAPNPEESVAEIQKELPSQMKQNFATTFASQRFALQNTVSELVQAYAPVSESRILIEFYYYKIRVVAAEQGYLEETATKRNTADRLDVLRKWAIYRGRLREARYLTYFRIDLANDNAEDLEVLQGFMCAIEGTNNTVEEAQTRLDLARCMIRSRDTELLDDAQQHIKKAEELFKMEEHNFGVLDLMDMQVNENEITNAEKLLDWKLYAANVYFEKACYQQGIRCLIFAVPVNHGMGEVFQQTKSIIERAWAEISSVGGVFLEQALFINAVAQTIVRAPEYGYAQESLEVYLANLPDEISPKNLGLLHACLRGAYTNIGNFEKALSHAEQALIISLEGRSYHDISDAAFALAITKLDRGRKFPPQSTMARLWFENLITFLSGWVAIDQLVSNHKQVVEKCSLLSSLENEIGLTLNDKRAFTRSDRWLDNAREYSESHVISSDQLHGMVVAQAIRLGNFDVAVDTAYGRFQSLQSKANTASFDLAQAATAASVTIYHRYRYRQNTLTNGSDVDRVSIIRDLVDATKLASEAFDLYAGAGGSEMIVTALNWLYDLLRHFPRDSSHDLMNEFLTRAGRVEDFCDAVRRSSATAGGVRSLLEKRSLISGKEYRNLYSNAIETCVNLGNISSAWIWIQKSKARALSDAFGGRALIPQPLLENIASDKELQALYEKDRLGTELALKSGPLDYLTARRQAEANRAEMRKHPLLTLVLDIQEGAFNVEFHESELADAMKLSSMPSVSIKYVDWFISTSKGSENKIILLVRELDGTTRSQTLEITTRTVETWIRRMLEFPEEASPPLGRDNARSKLRELAPLIQGLEEMTNEGDFLILSPSGVLNRVPIHALPLEKRTLIERNLIIYSSSATIFRQCHMRAAVQITKNDRQQGKAVFLAVYDGSATEAQLERSEIYDHANKVSVDSFPFDVHTGSMVTKSSFRQMANKSSWVHFHGHALFDKRDILQSCLVLSDGADRLSSDLSDPDSDPDPASAAGDSENLTVADIFNLDMLGNAPHFTLIGCNSSTQDIAPGDEPLGILSALLYAGATSVVGTLWPVDSHTARLFTKIFYEHLRQQVESQSRHQPGAQQFLVVNLAAALRSTVREMMDRSKENTKAPLHWAAYVLHGAWFHVLPKVHTKGNQSHQDTMTKADVNDLESEESGI